MIGTSLNQYRITASIGAGGMGEVFRARDTRLNRDVAIKVLPKDFAADADRLRRFEQEAKTLAALNHPNVLTIHDAGVHDGAPYLVSELLEGRTLREELNGGALPVRKATEYALQIAHGLAAAHSKGVIHRDLKPENIFVAKDGRVKILDFGLAKLRANPKSEIRNPKSIDADAPTVLQSTAADTTEPGRVMGTPSYMSPEQVRGEAADHRTDIFAFGCLLYEMLSGTRAFRRDTPVASMNAVLSEEPPELGATNPSIPLPLERVVRRCLEKQPHRRFQTADDLAFAVENAGSGSASSSGMARRAERPSFRFRSTLPWAVAAVCLAGLLLTVLRRADSDARTELNAIKPARKFDLTLPVSTRIHRQGSPLARGEDSLYPTISPDGRKLVYANAEGLWLRWLDQISPPLLLAQGDNISDLFWSPQSADVGYFAGRKLYRMSISGRNPLFVATAANDPAPGAAGGAWLGDRIIFTTGGSALLEAPAQGGKVTTALPLADGESDFHNASALPAGRGVLFVIHRTAGTPDRIAVMDSRGQRRVLLELRGSPLWRPVFAPPHHVIFQRVDEGRGIWAFSISLEKLERTGEPFRVSDAGAYPSAADDGTITYSLVTSGELGRWQLAWVERSGNLLNSISSAFAGLSAPRLSPDERRAVAIVGESATEQDVWLFDLAGGAASPLTRSGGTKLPARWWNSGRAVVFTHLEGGTGQVLSASVDGTTPEERLFEGQGVLSDSGKYLFVSRKSADGNATRGFISMADAQRKLLPLPELGRTRFGMVRLSPDDRLLAYHSNESGQFEVYLLDFPGFRTKVRVSSDGGQHAEWHPNGRELFYLDGQGRTLMSRKLKPDGTLEEPVKAFDFPESVQRGFPWFHTPYAVAQDGNRFLMLQKPPDESTPERATKPNVRVVMNWFEEFREKK